MSNKSLLAVLAAATVLLAACGKTEEKPKPVAAPAQPPMAAPAGMTVASISLGKAIGADKKVSAVTEAFGTTDTIYASIDTTGAGAATLRARWTYHKGGQVVPVKDDSQTIAPSGPATSEFHISKPDGWPAGDYQLEVFVGDKSAGVRKFSVK